jgi:hypothetical protein
LTSSAAPETSEAVKPRKASRFVSPKAHSRERSMLILRERDATYSEGFVQVVALPLKFPASHVQGGQVQF